MSEAAITKKDIPVGQLLLDQKNYRTGEVPSQDDALKAILADQGSNIIKLAEHIAEKGLGPHRLLMVAPDPQNKDSHIVLDGNRRLSAIRLVLNPSLASQTPHEKKFVELNKAYGQKIIATIPCVVFPDREAAKPWVRVEHYNEQNGINLEPWEPLAKARADRDDGKYNPVLDVLDFVKAGNALPSEIRPLVASSSFNSSNLMRLLDSTAVRAKLGLVLGKKSLKSKKNKEWLLKILSGMTAAIATEEHNNEKFTSRNINTNTQMAVFTDEIIASVGPASKAHEWVVNEDTAPQIKVKSKPAVAERPRVVPARPTWERETLIPGTFSQKHLGHTKLNNIYYELKRLDVKHAPNACALLLRLLLELSIRQYMHDHDVPMPADKKLNGMCHVTVEHMKASGLLDPKENAKIKAALQREPISITRELNDYVHDPQFHPDWKNLNITWDNLSVFFSILWKNLIFK